MRPSLSRQTILRNIKSSYISILALFSIMIFGISAIYSLHYFGISWDEGLGNLFFGERYLLFFQTHQEKFLDFKANLSYHNTTGLNLFLSPWRNIPYHFPPLMDTLSAWSMHTFSYNLRWMDPVDAFHLMKVIITLLFLIIFFFFFRKRLGTKVSFLGLLFLLTFPRLWGDMQINPKDVSSLIFFTFVILTYIYWYEKPDWKRAILVGFCFGLGLGTKVNILFAPVVLFFGWLPWKWNIKFWIETLEHFKKTWYHYIIFGFTSIGMYLGTWPYLFDHPERNLQYFRAMATQGDRVIQYVWNIEPFEHMLATMPELMLFFLIIGILYYKRIHNVFALPWYRLFLMWFFIPIFRISMPGQTNFDGIRHYYEFLPAAAIIAGFGGKYLGEWLEKKFSLQMRTVPAVLSILIVVTGFVNINYYFPYTYIYYNNLVGGITGAQRIFSENDTTDYWAISYREGLNWINLHAEPNSKIYVPVASWLVEIPQRIWIRQDIKVITEENADSVLLQKEPVYVMFINRPGYYNKYAEELRNSNQIPEYQQIVAGKPIMYIYKILPDNY